jgi:hypothetical protein
MRRGLHRSNHRARMHWQRGRFAQDRIRFSGRLRRADQWPLGRKRCRKVSSRVCSEFAPSGLRYPNRSAASRKGNWWLWGAPRYTARPSLAKSCHSNQRPGSCLRPGAISEWPITPCAAIPQRCITSLSKDLSAWIWAAGKA